MHRVLVVEDSEVFVSMFRELLGDTYDLRICRTGQDGIAVARGWKPHVVLLDLTLPDIDGTDVCTEIRSHSDAYIIMVTGRDGVNDLLHGLELGADDYLNKPFDGRELKIRLKTLLRRPVLERSDTRSWGPLAVDRSTGQAMVDGTKVHLTTIEFAFLERLLDGDGAAVDRADLALAAWGPDWVGDNHVINVHVGNLRKKLEASGTSLISAVRGVGYQLIDDERSTT